MPDPPASVTAQPLRLIVRRTEGIDWLECGHKLAAQFDRMGPTYPKRRRCFYCAAGAPAHNDGVRP